MQLPEEHVPWPRGKEQRLPTLPQLLTSDLMSIEVQEPSTSWKPGLQVLRVQVPEEQDPWPLGKLQTLLQRPQWLVSAWTLRQVEVAASPAKPEASQLGAHCARGRQRLLTVVTGVASGSTASPADARNAVAVVVRGRARLADGAAVLDVRV